MNDPTKIRGIIKFGDFKYMHRFRKYGQLYMNTLAYFRDLEKSDPRHDRSEGLKYFKSGEGAKIEFSSLPKKMDIVGPILIHDKNAINVNIFSLFGVTPINKDNLDLRLHEFGDTAVIILNGREFTNRVVKAAKKKKYKYRCDKVTYVDGGQKEGQMDAFKKFDRLQHESEYRVALLTNKKVPLEDFYIGDISDISTMCDSKTVINEYNFKTP